MALFALAQINPTVGDIQGNLQLIRRTLARIGAKAQLVVFPEGALPGYPAQDLLLERDFIANLQAALEALAGQITDQWVIVGTVREESGSRQAAVGSSRGSRQLAVGSRQAAGRKRLYNTAAVLHQGKIVAYRDKSLLPTYDVFDEARYFTPAREIEPVELTLNSGENVRVGLQICEDLWDGDYETKVTDRLGEQGVDLFINISASPFTVDRDPRRRELIAEKVRRWKRPFLYCNLVGGQDELVFDGRSLVFDSQGQLIKEGASFDEDLIFMDYPLDAATPLPSHSATASGQAAPARLAVAGLPVVGTARATPRPTPQPREELLAGAIELGIRDYFAKTGHREALIGLSGGIDSSVVAALAVRALGAANVTALAMPTTYNAPDSLEDARQLADGLGIKLQVIAIEQLRKQMQAELKPFFEGTEPGLAEENLQARLRGTLLMAVANKRGALLLTTGNKTELALGYATLYGDMAGALAPIGDLPKNDVYGLGRYLNLAAGKEIIPERVLTKIPSAELRAGQVDPFDYAVVAPLVEALVVNHASNTELAAQGYDMGLVRDLRRRITRSEYKRRQAAPVIRVTGKAFGVGRRYPIVNRYGPGESPHQI